MRDTHSDGTHGPERTHGPSARRTRVGYPIIVAALVIVGALLVMRSSFSGGTYSLDIGKIRSNPTRFLGHEVKIVGTVKPGSIHTYERGERIETDFTIDDGKGHQLAVAYPHSPPDPFKEGRMVIVQGTLQKGERVACSKLTVKCPSKYVKEGDGAGRTQAYYREKYGAPANVSSGPTS